MPHRAQIGDGEQFGIGVITSECSTLITSDAVVLNQCVVLTEYIINTLANNKKVCIIMNMEPVAVEEGAELAKIGGTCHAPRARPHPHTHPRASSDTHTHHIVHTPSRRES